MAVFSSQNKGKKEKISEASIAVLMLGQRRTGKSSMLASMLDSMEKQSFQSGLLFSPDKSTSELMEKKKANLEDIFTLHKGEAYFSTAMDNEITAYSDHFLFSLNRLQKKSMLGNDTGMTVEFIDIRGEDLRDDDAAIGELMAGTAIWMIAVDTPALMEDYDGVINRLANDPTLLHSRILDADELIRGSKKKQIPRLVLFVPLKCEKYYYSHQMDSVNARIKSQYKSILAYFEGHSEFTVAITPILTLGDVVFDHYEMTEKGGYVTIAEGCEDSLSGLERIPKALFRFRDDNGHYPCFSPLYCEQPLYYVLAYFLVCFEKIKQLSAGKNIWDAFRFMFGFFGYIRVPLERLIKSLSDRETRKALQNAMRNLKSENDGYEIVLDRINIKSSQQESAT